MKKYLRIFNIPPEVWAIACDYEGIPRGPDLDSAMAAYASGIDRVLSPNGGLEKAISDYITRAGAFSDGGEFSDFSGYILGFENE